MKHKCPVCKRKLKKVKPPKDIQDDLFYCRTCNDFYRYISVDVMKE